ncbi:MAG: hypothetical protein ABFD77_02765 [Thermotogota bacterium]
MDLFDFYFKQVVTQSQLDWAFERVQDAMHGLSLDNSMLGILYGLDPQQHAPAPDKTVDIVGPGVAGDPEGQRIYIGDALTVVDCSVDEFGTDTNPTPGTYQRYISIFVRFKRNLTEPMLDGNNIKVWTKQLESAEFFVRIGASAPAGTAIPAPLMADARLVIDILVTNGFTAILNGDLDFSRREDWVRFVGTAIGSRVYGTPKDAVDDILSLIDSWGASLPFTFTSQWFGAVPVGGVAPPPTTIQQALNAIVYDLGAAGPPAGDTLISATDFTGTYFSWAALSISGALAGLAGVVDSHIGGAAPQHPASSIVFTPYSWIAAAQMQLVVQEIVDDLAVNGAVTSGASRVGWFDNIVAGLLNGVIGNTTVQGAIKALAETLQATAATCGAARIGTDAIAGTPESIAVSNVFAVLTAIYGHLNARTERSTVETVDARWIWQNTGSTPVNRARQLANQQFQNAPFMKTQLGGGVGATYDMAAVASGLYTAGYFAGEPWSSGIDLGIGVNACDLCMFQNQTTKVRQVGFLVDKGGAGTYPANAINSFFWMDQYNPTGYVLVNLNTVVDGLPAPVVRWRPMSCCSDGHYVYVLFEDYNGGASTHRVQAYDMIAGTKHPSWPVGGLLLTGTGQSSSRVSQRIKVIELDMSLGGGANKLAVLNSWVSGTVAGTSQCVSIIDATNGVLLGEGCGDMPVSGVQTIRTQEALASDGANVYFGYHNWTTGAGGIATLQISSPSSGKATGTWPRALMPAACPVDLVFDGNQLWSSANDAPAAPYSASMVHCFNFETDTSIRQMIEATPTILALGHLAFDGMNVWVQAIRDMDGGGTSDLEVLFKLPVVEARPLSAWTAPDAETRERVVYLQPGVEIATVNMDHMGRTLFDGDGVHVVLNSHALGDGMEGKTRCVTMAHKR